MPKPSGMEPVRFRLADTSFYLVPIATGFEIHQHIVKGEKEYYEFIFYFTSLKACAESAQYLFLGYRLQQHKSNSKRDLRVLELEYKKVVTTLIQFYEANRQMLNNLHTALLEG
jgi:hypothetical protein